MTAPQPPANPQREALKRQYLRRMLPASLLFIVLLLVNGLILRPHINRDVDGVLSLVLYVAIAISIVVDFRFRRRLRQTFADEARQQDKS